MYKNTTNARICVNQKHVCDGQFDCLKGEDEADETCPKVIYYTKNCVFLKKDLNECWFSFCRRKSVRKTRNVNNYV